MEERRHLSELSLRSFVCQDALVGCHTAHVSILLSLAMGQPRRGSFLSRRKRSMTADERRMLELLAASDDGCTEAILLAHGFALNLIDSFVSAGFATATAERTFAAGRAIEFTRLRITDAGRQKLTERR